MKNKTYKKIMNKDIGYVVFFMLGMIAQLILTANWKWYLEIPLFFLCLFMAAWLWELFE
jgi:hypothetical protein